MEKALTIVGVVLAISLLVIIHEFGHYLVARAFGMRVLTYSIGFGPVIARWRPKGSETVFQIAAIPVLAYVQVAGMNPREAVDPHDRGSYQNARPLARFLMIAAGPLANYFAASLAVFALLAFGGERLDASARAIVGDVSANKPAAAAGLRADDAIVAINDVATPTWGAMLDRVRASNGQPLRVRYTRAGEASEVSIVPRPLVIEGHTYFGIGITQRAQYRPVTLRRAASDAVTRPAMITAEIVQMLSKIFRREIKDAQLMGPVRMVQETAQQASKGWRDGLSAVAIISLQLFIMNLLPIPVLDGGRLILLAYEMVARRKPNPAIEARILAGSMMLMLGLFLFVTSRELWGIVRGLFGG
ncbi:MAG: M50 family metallopeptidase [Deltaproteobacteria bacterium]|nr:M50 family metallopeptidase [Deltaproteobacteria bacterium]